MTKKAMTKKELIREMNKLEPGFDGDCDLEMVQLLIKFIDDPDIKEAYEDFCDRQD